MADLQRSPVPAGASREEMRAYLERTLEDLEQVLLQLPELSSTGIRVQLSLQVDGDVGFYGTAPIAKQLGVPVTAAGVHAALVALGLIT